ncbi:hypothetical protein R3P38DRAFT_3262332 [Favolaschia claudopus]|uniref:Uncharacterized protein n=1 Tax=Favolaschia claudopus TaxID=2862362 RepID=A0AAW0CMF6_9AGAR
MSIGELANVWCRSVDDTPWSIDLKILRFSPQTAAQTTASRPPMPMLPLHVVPSGTIPHPPPLSAGTTTRRVTLSIDYRIPNTEGWWNNRQNRKYDTLGSSPPSLAPRFLLAVTGRPGVALSSYTPQPPPRQPYRLAENLIHHLTCFPRVPPASALTTRLRCPPLRVRALGARRSSETGSLFARVTNHRLPSLFPSPHLSLIARAAPRLPRTLAPCNDEYVFISVVSPASSLSGVYHAVQRPYRALHQTRHPACSARNPASTAATTLGFSQHITRHFKELPASRIGSPPPPNAVSLSVSGSAVPPFLRPYRIIWIESSSCRPARDYRRFSASCAFSVPSPLLCDPIPHLRVFVSHMEGRVAHLPPPPRRFAFSPLAHARGHISASFPPWTNPTLPPQAIRYPVPGLHKPF